MKSIVKGAFFFLAMISLATACQSKKTEENASTSADSTSMMSTDTSSTMATDTTMATDSASSTSATSTSAQ